MSTDRELLEAAAKAAGMHFEWEKSISDPTREEPCVFDDDGFGVDWNPLTNSGDALELAVKLGLDIFCRPGQWSECGRIGQLGAREPHGDAPVAATCRAITRAAAAIGKASA